MSGTITTTTQFTYLDTLQARLAARPGLADVHVVSGVIDPDRAAKPDVLMLFGSEGDIAFAALGNRRHEEDYEAAGQIVVMRAGAGEDAIRAVRARARAILTELERALREDHTLGGLVVWQRVARVEIDQGYSDRGRLCVVTFRVAAKATLPRG